MRYRTRVLEVEAMRLTQVAKIGGLTGTPGDYLVDHAGAGLQLVKRKEFEARFESIVDAVTPRPPRRGGGPKKVGPRRGPSTRGGGKPGRPPKPVAAAAAAPGRRKSPLDEKRATARKMFEQDRLELQVIADKLGVHYSTVWNWKSNGGWE